MTIAVVDDFPIFRNAIRKELEILIPKVTVLEAKNGTEALELIKANKGISVMLLDMSMPVMDGWELLTHIQRFHLKTFKIIAFTLYNNPTLIHNLLELGVEGYVSKDSDIETLINAIKIISKGGLFYSEEYDQHIKEIIHSRKILKVRISKKEKEIFKYLAEGKTSKEISGKLQYTLRTVETKRLRLEKKLYVKNTAELISISFKLGLLKL